MTEDGSIAGMASDWLPEALNTLRKAKQAVLRGGNGMSPLLGVNLD